MPTPDTIRSSRLSLGLTQQQAGAMVGASARAWRAWEAGFRVMPGAKWELFNIKAGKMKNKLFKCELIDAKTGVVLERFMRKGTSARAVREELEMFQWEKGVWIIVPDAESA